MKQAEYYINNGTYTAEYPKVKGYIETVTGINGEVLTIGYDKRSNGFWIATELHTGMRCSLQDHTSRKSCAEEVHGNIETIIHVYNRRIQDDSYYIKYIQPFRNYSN